MKVKYAIAHYDEDDCAGRWLSGIGSNTQMLPGWYRLGVDEKGRVVFESGPHDTADNARKSHDAGDLRK